MPKPILNPAIGYEMARAYQASRPDIGARLRLRGRTPPQRVMNRRIA